MKREATAIDKKGFGERIRSRREYLGLKQSQLAKAIGVNSNSVSYYEAGTALPSVDTTLQIANALNTTVDYLVGLSDEPNTDKHSLAAYANHVKGLLEIKGFHLKKGEGGTYLIEAEPGALTEFLGEYYDHLREITKPELNELPDEQKEKYIKKSTYYIDGIVEKLSEIDADTLPRNTELDIQNNTLPMAR